MNDVVQYQGNQGGALSVTELRSQLALIQEVMRDVMTPGIDYGYIPGTEPRNEDEKKFKKPALFQAGAEKLAVLFRLGPDYDIINQERDGDHLTITSKCTLTHIPTGNKFGSALGSCSTMESKYAYRKGVRKCPACGAEAIIKGKAEYGGGWLCFQKKSGCGAKFADGDPAIEEQQAGKVANEDKADQFNTVLKMANKRAFTSAIKGATAASAIFSVDIVDEDDIKTGDDHDPQKKTAERQKPAAKKTADPERKIDPAQKITPAHEKIVVATAERATISTTEICKQFNVEKLSDLPFAKLNEVLAWIQNPA